MTRRKTPESVVQSVERSLQIIDLLAEDRSGRLLSQISEALSLNVSTVHRLLSTLMAHGYVEQEKKSGAYRLSIKFISIGARLMWQTDVRIESLPHLRDLVEVTGETVHLGIIDQMEVVYVEKLEGRQAARMHSKVGARSPMHCTGLGKAILAFLPAGEISFLVESRGLKRYTPTTRTTEESLREDLHVIKAQGYAIDDEEHELNIRCIAAPIFNHSGEVIAAISIAGEKKRMTDERFAELSGPITTAAARISEKLGYQSAAGAGLPG